MEYKKGDKHPTKDRIFWSYTSKDRSIAKEQWLTKEAYERKCLNYKKYLTSSEHKDKRKEYYSRKKEYFRLKQKENLIHNSINNPFTLLINSIKLGAKRRKLLFDININDLQEIWENQKGLCFYTKIPMNFTFRLSYPKQMSIDRKDSLKGYTKDNIVFCCQAINYAKHDYNLEEFSEFINELKNIV